VDGCCFLRASFLHFHVLFEKGGNIRTKLLSSLAPVFFGDLSQMLKEYLILQICRLTDAEEMRGDKNLTISFFVNNADFSQTPREGARLAEVSGSIHEFRKLILPARHKIVSHQDREAALDGKPLGAASKEAWDQFWKDLREFVQIIHRRHIDPHQGLDIDDIVGLTDAEDLVTALKQSTYFTTLMRDAGLLERCMDVAEGSEYFDA